MAKAFGGILIGLHVETRNSDKASMEDKKRLKDHIHLAEQLGAKIETVCGDDVPFLIAEYAKISGVSKIVTGRSAVQAGFIRKPTFTDKLSAYAPDMDIYIIPDNKIEKARQKFSAEHEKRITVRNIAYAVACLLIATGIGFVFYKMKFSDTNIITIYILGVMISAILTSSREISFVQSIVSVVIFNYFFTEPKLSLKTYDPGYPVTFMITFIAALITSNLALKMKMQAKELAKSAYRTKIILDINQTLQSQKSIADIGNTMAEQLSKVLGRCVVFYGWNGEHLGSPVVYGEKGRIVSSEKKELVTENEKAVAEWVLKNNKRAGVSTGTLSEAACYYLAVRSLETVYGVIGIEMKHEEVLNAFENNVVMAVLSETATVLERETLRMKEEAAIEKANNEKLRANLLRSISHDLRTPLTSICGNADMLLQGKLDEDKKEKIYGFIYEDSLWLINLVENLLSVTRIEKGKMEIKKEADMLEDLIEEALKHISRKSKEYCIQVIMENEFQLVNVDSRLILQVIINIVDNAVKYTPSGGKIIIRTKKEKNYVHVMISDNGNGIPDKDKEHIFDMFYTASGKIADLKRSLGLGLALCKAIVEAHGGMITVYNNKPKGSVFDFTIPSEEVLIHE